MGTRNEMLPGSCESRNQNFFNSILSCLNEISPLLDEVAVRIQDEQRIRESLNREEIERIRNNQERAVSQRVLDFRTRLENVLRTTPIKPKCLLALREEIFALPVFKSDLRQFPWEQAQIDLRSIKMRLEEILDRGPVTENASKAQKHTGKPGRPPIDPKRKDEALKAKQNGASNRDCAKILYNVSYPTDRQARNVAAILKYHKSKAPSQKS